MIATVYPFYMLLKKYVAILLRENEYSGRRLAALKAHTEAFIDGQVGKLGKTIDPQRSSLD